MGHTAVGVSSPTDSTKVAEVATVAAVDSGQAAMLVRVVSTNAAGSGGGPATIADGADVAEGATTDAAVVTNTTGTISGKLRGLVAWAYGRMPAALGQTTMTASLPVVLASDQSALTVASHAVTNVGTFAVQAAATLAAETTKVIGTVNQGTSPWVTNDPGLPDTLGQKTMANSTGVVLASDQASVPVAATLAAETTKVIGTVNQGTSPWVAAATLTAETTKVIGVTRTADGSGNLLTATSNALDVNLKSGAIPTGSNVIGHVIADASSAVIGHVINDAGTALIGQVSGSDETSTIYSGTTALTPLFANLTASASGVTQLIALVSSKKIRVVALSLVANAAVNVKFQSHVTPTDKSGLYYLAANTGMVLGYNPVGWFETISGEALDINLSGAVAVGGNIVYVTV